MSAWPGEHRPTLFGVISTSLPMFSWLRVNCVPAGRSLAQQCMPYTCARSESNHSVLISSSSSDRSVGFEFFEHERLMRRASERVNAVRLLTTMYGRLSTYLRRSRAAAGLARSRRDLGDYLGATSAIISAIISVISRRDLDDYLGDYLGDISA